MEQNYYVNNNPQSNGDHEVHVSTAAISPWIITALIWENLKPAKRRSVKQAKRYKKTNGCILLLHALPHDLNNNASSLCLTSRTDRAMKLLYTWLLISYINCNSITVYVCDSKGCYKVSLQTGLPWPKQLQAPNH